MFKALHRDIKNEVFPEIVVKNKSFEKIQPIV